MNIQDKVEKLKRTNEVEGSPLIKSNLYTDEQIQEMRSKSKAHESHWYHLNKGAKTYTDEEIAIQIETFNAMPTISEQKFKDIVNIAFKALPIKDKELERQRFRELLFGILGWTEKRNCLSDMWRPFGSAPSREIEDIFDGKFSQNFHIVWYGVNRALNEFEEYWDTANEKNKLKAEEFTSPFKDLDDIEENVVMKKIPEAAKTFYLDKTKSFNERVKVFSKHGYEDSSIFHPSDPDLKKIFDIYGENGWVERHQIVESADVVWEWIDRLRDSRCHLNWANPYHPKIDKTQRNYKPSQEAIERLYRFYVEKLFLEGVGSFEWDW